MSEASGETLAEEDATSSECGAGAGIEATCVLSGCGEADDGLV